MRTLESLGHRVVEASAAQGLRTEVASIDGVIVDPSVAAGVAQGRDAEDLGLDLVLRLRRLLHGLPIAVMSADGRADLVVRTMRLGVVDYVTKPADRARLLVAAGRLVEAQGDPSLGRTTLPPLADIEKGVIELALRWNRGQVARTARMLGIGRATLYRKLAEMGRTPAARAARMTV